LFVHACACCRSSMPFPTILVYPFVLVSAGPRLSPLGCTGWPSCLLLLVCALRCLFVPFAACLCPSLLVCALHCLFVLVCWSPFVPARLCLLGCAGSHSVVLVPAAWLRPFGLCSCLPGVVCAQCLSPHCLVALV
jgi:hypothetical protein